MGLKLHKSVQTIAITVNKMECMGLITIGISESDDQIKRLANHCFSQQGLKCGTSLRQTEKDFIFCPPKKNGSYDILIENSAPAYRLRADYIHLVNSDDVVPSLSSEQSVLITYGLNSLATVTASSIAEDDAQLRFQFCLQRNIVSLKGRKIECQEFPVAIYHAAIDIHSAIAFATLALISSIPAVKLSQIILPAYAQK